MTAVPLYGLLQTTFRPEKSSICFSNSSGKPFGNTRKGFDVQAHNFPVTGHSIFSTEISSNLVA